MKNNRQLLQAASLGKRTVSCALLALVVGICSGVFLDRAVSHVSHNSGDVADRVKLGAIKFHGKLAMDEDYQSEEESVRQSQDKKWLVAPTEGLREESREVVEIEVSETDVEKARKVTMKSLLKRAARKGDQVEPNAVIVTAISEGWARPGNVLDVFLGQMMRVDSLRALMKNFVIFCLDDYTFRRCLQVHSYQLCYAPEEEAKEVDFSGGELQYMGEAYKKMCWQKVDLAYKASKLGYGVLATDLDIVWFRDPFPVFSTLYSDRDWFHSADIWHGTRDDFKGVMFNGGFYYARSTPANHKIYQAWLSVADRFVADQEGMNGFKAELYEGKTFGDVDLKHIQSTFAILPTHLFGGLCQMICTLEELRHVVTIHMNCCFRSEAKMERMKAFMKDHELALALDDHSVFGNSTLVWNKQRYACIYEDIGCSPEW